MDDLAAELNVSKKTLYAHFLSKDGLLAAVLQSKYESIRRVLREVTSQRLPHFPAGPLRDQHRRYAKKERHGGHQDRPIA